MHGAEVVEIGPGAVVECSRRLLLAIHGGNLKELKRELAHGARISRTLLPDHAQSALVEEQGELLGAIIERIDLSLEGYEPCSEEALFLLGHLAGEAAICRTRIRAGTGARQRPQGSHVK